MVESFKNKKRNICGSYYHGIVWDTAANKWAVEDQEEEGWRRERTRRILHGFFWKTPSYQLNHLKKKTNTCESRRRGENNREKFLQKVGRW